MGGIVNTLDMDKEAYYIGYTLSNLVAKVEFAYLYLDKVAKHWGIPLLRVSIVWCILR